MIDWLTLVQHYGAPTRMLDWTTSPLVAMHFAMEQDDYTDPSAVWAIDGQWLRMKSRQLIEKHDADRPSTWTSETEYEYFCRTIESCSATHPVIVNAAPRVMNDRIRIQRGHVLCDLRDDFSFSVALLGMFVHPTVELHVVSKAVISREHRNEFVSRLRSHGIDHSTLFQGSSEPGDSVRKMIRSKIEQQVQDYVADTIAKIRKRRRTRPRSGQTVTRRAGN